MARATTLPLPGGRGAALGGIGLLPLLAFCWGLNWPAVRLCLVEIPPWTLRACGFTLATLLLVLVVRARGGSLAVPRAHWGRLVLVGFLATTAYNMLTAFAQLSASTTRSAVLSYTMPIWAVIFASLVLGEPFDRRRRLGLGLGIAGLLALGWPLVAARELSWGLAFAVLSGMSWAASSTVLKRYPIDASPLVVATWQLAQGAVATGIGTLLFEELPQSWPHLPATWAAFAFHVVFAQAAAMVLWVTILERLPAGTAAIGTLVIPGIGVLGATLLLGEHPTGADWLGLVLIVAAAATVLLPGAADPRPGTVPA